MNFWPFLGYEGEISLRAITRELLDDGRGYEREVGRGALGAYA
jgi:hypothetical protein